MNAAAIIEVIVDTEGRSRITTKGFAGSSCQQATRDLEQSLGLTTSETLTSEYYQAQESQQQQQSQG